MFVIGIMLVGVLIGFLLKKTKLIRMVDQTILHTIYLLLFSLGMSVGSDEAIVRNIGELGGTAAGLAVMGVLGSSLAAKLVYDCFFKK